MSELQQAIQLYFAGERVEMIAIVAGSILALLASIGLFAVARDGFATGLLATVLLFSVMLGATAGSLLVRDSGRSRDMIAALSDRETALRAAQEEQQRIATVLSNYRYYRYAAAVLVALAVAALLFSGIGWIHGVASGLFLLACAQTVIDRYSERRAEAYAAVLDYQIAAALGGR